MSAFRWCCWLFCIVLLATGCSDDDEPTNDSGPGTDSSADSQPGDSGSQDTSSQDTSSQDTSSEDSSSEDSSSEEGGIFNNDGSKDDMMMATFTIPRKVPVDLSIT